MWSWRSSWSHCRCVYALVDCQSTAQAFVGHNQPAWLPLQLRECVPCAAGTWKAQRPSRRGKVGVRGRLAAGGFQHGGRRILQQRGQIAPLGRRREQAVEWIGRGQHEQDEADRHQAQDAEQEAAHLVNVLVGVSPELPGVSPSQLLARNTKLGRNTKSSATPLVVAASAGHEWAIEALLGAARTVGKDELVLKVLRAQTKSGGWPCLLPHRQVEPS